MNASQEAGAVLKPASLHTCQVNAAQAARLDFGDDRCFDEAQRGFVGSIPDARITTPDGRVVWDLSAFAFLEQVESPDSVHPSLWRQARLNRIHGLFKVCDRLYQVRGFDIANLTIIEGDTGLILIDPLMVSETAAAALALYRQHRGERPVRCVIYSHSHVDHYGGVEGVITPAQAARGEVQVIAPGRLHGSGDRREHPGRRADASSRRLPVRVDAGAWASLAHRQRPGQGHRPWHHQPDRTEPADHARRWSGTRIDGVDIVFQLTPETEAPAEMNFHFPQFKVLNLAENGCHTMHNLCPIRGAKTRDALAWSKYLDAALNDFIEDTDVVIAQHHWPTWGRERARKFITEQRDLYRLMHDQTLRLMSHGLTPHEIAQDFRLPASLEKSWHVRPVLRRHRPQRARGVRALHGPLRRQPGEPGPAGAAARPRRSTSSTWAVPMPRWRVRWPTSTPGTTAGWCR